MARLGAGAAKKPSTVKANSNDAGFHPNDLSLILRSRTIQTSSLIGRRNNLDNSNGCDNESQVGKDSLLPVT
jgi:hypothetical protein